MGERAEKVAAQIRRELAELIREVHDPRVVAATLVTITHVTVSDDLSVARVLVSVIGDDPNSVVQGLGRARGFLQGQIGRRLRMKKVPELRVFLDQTEERAGKIEQILKEIHDESGEKP